MTVMARLLEDSETPTPEFELGDSVYFYHNGARLYGNIVRVYNTRDVYHVEVDGSRYEVTPYDGLAANKS